MLAIFSRKLGELKYTFSLVTSFHSGFREEYIEPIPEAERHDMILAYHAQLNSVDDTTRIKAAKAWSKWEMATSRLFVDPDYLA